MAIQLARLAGARVCTTVSGPRKAELARSLGADRTIDYKQEDLVEAVMDWTGGRGVDVALDTVGPEVLARTIPAMAHYGDLVTILQPAPDQDWKEVRSRNLRIGFELMLTPLLRELPEARAHQGKSCAAAPSGSTTASSASRSPKPSPSRRSPRPIAASRKATPRASWC